MKKTKILFISYYFQPDNVIGALRATKLVKFLTRDFNCVCDVITVENETKKLKEREEVFAASILTIKEDKHKLQNNGSSQANKITTTMEKKQKPSKFRYVGFSIKHVIKQHQLLKRAKKQIKHIDFTKYDAVFSTFGPEFNHLLANFIKKKNNNLTWIADFRDPVYNLLYTPKLLSRYKKSFVRKYCKDANYITAVSTGYSKALYYKDSQKIRVITNGYDDDDFKQGEVTKFSKFTFFVSGNLYDGRRSISPVIRAVSELVESRTIAKDNLQFLYSGVDSAVLKEELGKYNLSELLLDKGYNDRNEVLNMQQKSHVLLLSTWNYESYEGVIPGKFYEYLSSGTHIFAIVTGNKGNSEIREYIQKTNSGICYEFANKEHDYEVLKNNIIELYIRYIDGNFSAPELNEKELEKFNYANISGQLYRLIKSEN